MWKKNTMFTCNITKFIKSGRKTQCLHAMLLNLSMWEKQNINSHWFIINYIQIILQETNSGIKICNYLIHFFNVFDIINLFVFAKFWRENFE